MLDKFITDGLKVLGCVVGEVRAEEHVCLLELLDAAGEISPGIQLINIFLRSNDYSYPIQEEF